MLLTRGQEVIMLGSKGDHAGIIEVVDKRSMVHGNNPSYDILLIYDNKPLIMKHILASEVYEFNEEKATKKQIEDINKIRKLYKDNIRRI